jgi:hypothetical protein
VLCQELQVVAEGITTSSISRVHEFILIFPRDGETIIKSKESVIEICFYIYPTAETLIDIDGQTEYSINIYVQDASIASNFSVRLDLFVVPLSRTCGEFEVEDDLVVVDASVTIISPTNVVVNQFRRQLLIVPESDVALGSRFYPASVEAPSNSRLQPRLDFVEIGSSNFNTCVMMRAHHCNISHTSSCQGDHVTSGVTVDLVSAYLDFIPDLNNVRKYQVAITGSESGRSVLATYLIPPSVMKRLPQIPYFVAGCVQLNDLHKGIVESVINHRLPPSIIQKHWVRTMSLHSFFDANVRYPVRLLKVDAEGYDGEIIEAMVNYYQVALNEVKISPRWPCFLFFEMSMLNDRSVEASLIRQLEDVGYKSYSGADPMDAAFVNCYCDDYDFDVVSMYVLFDNYTLLEKRKVSLICHEEFV